MRRRKAPTPLLPPGGGPVTRKKKLEASRPPPGDPISNLPNDILGEIITLLPVKDGARTQILASRWRSLWRSAPLNVDSRDIAGMGVKLDGVVRRILSSHPGPARRFCFSQYHQSSQSTTGNARLRSPALRNLEELEYSFFKHPPAASVPRFSPTLRALTIRSCRLLPDGNLGALHFPLLKHLGLQQVGISECALHSLIDGCPALESLLIHHSFGFRHVRISSLTITSIGVDNRIIWRVKEAEIPELQELIIDNAPRLERLLLNLEDSVHVSLATAPRLETIGFLSDGEGNEEHVSRLVFGSTVIQGLRFDRLVTAVRAVKILALRMTTLCLDTVVELLKCFPCLEKLYIEPYFALREPKNLWRRKHEKLTKCNDIRLKTMVSKLYRGIESQVNFAAFFVLNARMLETVTLEVETFCYSKKFVEEQYEKLQFEKRASRDAKVHFTTDRCMCSSSDIHYVPDLDVVDPFKLPR